MLIPVATDLMPLLFAQTPPLADVQGAFRAMWGDLGDPKPHHGGACPGEDACEDNGETIDEPVPIDVTTDRTTPLPARATSMDPALSAQALSGPIIPSSVDESVGKAAFMAPPEAGVSVPPEAIPAAEAPRLDTLPAEARLAAPVPIAAMRLLEPAHGAAPNPLAPAPIRPAVRDGPTVPASPKRLDPPEPRPLVTHRHDAPGDAMPPPAKHALQPEAVTTPMPARSREPAPDNPLPAAAPVAAVFRKDAVLTPTPTLGPVEVAARTETPEKSVRGGHSSIDAEAARTEGGFANPGRGADGPALRWSPLVHTAPHAPAVVSQIVAHVPDQPGVAFDLALDPVDLGNVSLKLVQSDQGGTLFVTAERPEILDLLRRNIGMLQDDLRSLGHGSLTLAFSLGARQDGAARRGTPMILALDDPAPVAPPPQSRSAAALAIDRLDLRL